MKWLLTIACALNSCLGLPSHAQVSKANRTERTIICLTYDDGLPSHLKTVVPQLDSFGLKGTFFLNGIQGSSTAIGETSPAVSGWTNAARNGHELANHTLFHACPEKLGWPKAFAIEGYTLDKLIAEIKAENALLALLDPKRPVRAFAYPCNNFIVGGVDYASTIKAKGLVRFGREGGDRTSVVRDFKAINSMKMPSWMVEEGTSLRELTAFAERARKQGTMGIYQFHGIGGEFFKIPAATHRAFLVYLKQHEADYWVATFSEAMNAVAAK